MSNLLADAFAVLNGQLTDFASAEWTYIRGLQSCTVNITEDAAMLRIADGQGRTKIERPQFVGSFSADELDFGDDLGQFTPRDGDIIQKTLDDGTTIKRYRLAPQNNGQEPSWHYCTPSRERIMIYGKELADDVA